MLSRIKNSFEKFGSRTAASINGKKYTYTELAEVTSDIRNYIEKKCDKDEKLIGIVAKELNSLETYASIYGTLFAGKGYVPVNPSNPAARNKSVFIQTGIKTLLCDDINNEIIELAKQNNLNVINIKAVPKQKMNLSLPETGKDQIAYILFTSGSTGKPKGVPITIGNLNAFIDAFLNLGYDTNENDRFLQMFELTFDFSVICYFVPLCIGASFHTVPAEGIKFANVYTTMEEEEITFACLVPSVVSYLKPYFEDISLDKIKYSLFCGETLFQDIAKEWSACIPNGKIINAYGPTEATVFCLTFDWNKNGSEKKTFKDGICIGKEMKNVEALVVDENLRPLKTGATGELCLSGPQITSGYWNDPSKTSESFFIIKIDGEEKRFYRTGDLTIKDSDGDFMFCGRIDSQIKIQGFRIELGEIEHYAREITYGNTAAVAYKNNSGIMHIHLFVENFGGNADDVSKFLKSKLPDYMIPAGISVLPNLPLNNNGKTDRKELLNILGNV